MKTPRQMIEDFYCNNLRLENLEYKALTNQEILKKKPSCLNQDVVISSILDYLDYQNLMNTNKKWWEFWK